MISDAMRYKSGKAGLKHNHLKAKGLMKQMVKRKNQTNISRGKNENF